ncbi:MAG: hypothetical protein IJD64_00760 [Clostridia bacterium]|nr:hypothetical protein [Clostridia bacterium]
MNVFGKALAIFSFEDYENLTENALFSVPLIVIGVFIGIAIALFATVFNKRVLGGMVRKLLSEEALSSESAKTLDELGLANNFFLRYAVKGNVSLRRVVYCREEDEFLQKQEEERKNAPSPKKFRAKSFRVDPKLHHFYIPEEQKDTAATKFEKKGTSLVALGVLLLVLFLLLIALLFALPKLMGWLDQLLGSVSSASSNDIV